MINDIKMREIFPVDFARVVLDVDHKKILNYTLKFVEGIDHYTTYHDPDTNKEWRNGLPELDVLAEDITEAAREFCKRSGRKMRSDTLLTMWASVYNDGKGHGAHIHRRSLLSGTYYPIGTEQHSRIIFESPYQFHTMHDNIDEDRLTESFKPKEGDMLMWPSWLQHRVQEQTITSQSRVAISWNIDSRRA